MARGDGLLQFFRCDPPIRSELSKMADQAYPFLGPETISTIIVLTLWVKLDCKLPTANFHTSRLNWIK